MSSLKISSYKSNNFGWSYFRRTANFFAVLLLLIVVEGCQKNTDSNPNQTEESNPVETTQSDGIFSKGDQNAKPELTPLFDGKSLAGWLKTNFGGEGDVEIVDGCIILSMGYPMTGVTSTRKELPNSNYEIFVEAKRVNGNDFFCGLTFPVKDSHCTLIAGGWGGSLVGLSCIDGFDASENSTSTHITFDNERWYRFKIRVTNASITTWIDEKEVIHQDIVERKISVRNETLPSRPLGICSFESKAAIRNFSFVKIAAKPENPTRDRDESGK